MKKNLFLLFLIVAVLAVPVGLFAQTAGKYYRTVNQNTRYTADLYLSNTTEVGHGMTSIALTSPTVTFSAENAHAITLTSNADLTGVYPIDGEVGQELLIMTGAGANTIRLDDGSKTNVGSNLTLTEGQGDVVKLLCITAPDVWVKTSGSDN